MKRNAFIRLARGALFAGVVAALSLATFQDARAHHTRRRVVVHRHHHRMVYVRPAPVVVHYEPAYHHSCVVRSGYYYGPAFGYHRHAYHPGGIHFGVHLVF